MKQLKDIVDDIVRPILADKKRKNKMREELLAHLTEIYQEELAKGDNEDRVLQQTLTRFGDPAILQRDLQSSVPFFERTPQIVRSIFFAFIVYLVWVIFMGLIYSWSLITFGNRNWSFSVPIVVWQSWSIGYFFILPFVVSYLSRIFSSRSVWNIRLQFLGIYIFDRFMVVLIEPRFRAIWEEMGFNISIFKLLWISIFLLGNIICILWIWKKYKEKKIPIGLSLKVRYYRNISTYSGILGFLFLFLYNAYTRFFAIWLILSYLFIFISIIYFILSYWQENKNTSLGTV